MVTNTYSFAESILNEEGWQKVTLGDIAFEVSDRVENPSKSGIERFVGLEHINSGSFTIKRWGGTEDVTSAMKLFRSGDTLFARRNAYLKRASLATFDGVCSGDAIVLREKPEMIIEGFLTFILNTDALWDFAIANAAGSMSKRVKWKDLATYKFALPPKDEQQRIADILWAVEDVTKKTHYTLEQVKLYKDTLMQASFEPNVLRKNGKAFKLMSLNQVLSFASDGPFGSKLKTEHYTQEGARVIRLQNIGDGFFNNKDKAYISNVYYLTLTKYMLKAGDVVVAGLGDEAHALGRACQVPDYLGMAVNKADCFCLRANPSFLQQEYLLYFLNSSYARSQIDQLVQGTTRARINVSNLKSITIPILEKESQQNICRIFKALDETYSQLTANLKLKRDLVKTLRENLLESREHF